MNLVESLPPLISAAELRALQASNAPFFLIDSRFDLSDPTAGAMANAQRHIPGARYLSLDECCGPKHSAAGQFRGRHPLPTREAFAQTLARLGWRQGLRAVVYDASGGMFAARVWWMLLWLGERQVQVLDGGFPAWTALGFDVTEVPIEPAPQAPPDGLPPSLVDEIGADELQRRLGRVKLIDARASERFRGDVEPLDREAGHIPGALNRPYAHNLQADGRFLSPEVLRSVWQPLTAGADDVVHQCGSGVTACHNLLAMAAAGLPLGRLYAGSWSEWSSEGGRPIAKGGSGL